MLKAIAILCIVVVACTSIAPGAGATRTLSQAAAPPNARFGGPAIQLSSEVAAPSGTFAKINSITAVKLAATAGRGVGTQNYSSGATSQYAAAGATADMFLQNGTKVGKHFFVKNSDGSISPAFTRESSTGQLLGTVVGTLAGSQNAPASNDDGGYGSIPEILLKVTSADGFFAGVTHIQRVNTLGGVVPGSPKLFTLPASLTGVANSLLTVPYQADYLFLAPGSAPPPTSGQSGRH